MSDHQAIVDELAERAERRGFVTLDEVQQALHDIDAEADSLDALITRLESAGVKVHDVDLDEGTGPMSDGRTPTDNVRTYLREIGTVKLLSAEQEVALAMQIEAGRRAVEQLEDGQITDPAERAELRADVQAGELAHRRMVEANLRLVVTIAKRYRGHNVQLLDLVQEGSIGLIRAVDRFDYRRGFRFSTYAAWWIRQMIQRALANQGRTIRVPARLQDALRKMAKVQRQLTQTLGRPPRVDEIAEAMDVEADEVSELRRIEPRAVSLDMPVGDDGSTTMADLIEDDVHPGPVDVTEAHLIEAYIEHALESLRKRERRILQMRFGLGGSRPHTLEEIAQDIGVTRERIRQIEARALAKLRHPSRLGAHPELLEEV